MARYSQARLLAEIIEEGSWDSEEEREEYRLFAAFLSVAERAVEVAQAKWIQRYSEHRADFNSGVRSGFLTGLVVQALEMLCLQTGVARPGKIKGRPVFIISDRIPIGVKLLHSGNRPCKGITKWSRRLMGQQEFAGMPSVEFRILGWGYDKTKSTIDFARFVSPGFPENIYAWELSTTPIDTPANPADSSSSRRRARPKKRE